MPIGILGQDRNIGPNLNYTPAEGCTARSITLSRAGADDALGQSKVKPLLMVDPDFWADATYPQIIQAIADSVSRDWTTSSRQTGTKKTGSVGIKRQVWRDLRGQKYAATEMIGAMLAKLLWRRNKTVHADYVVSAAPNMVFNTRTQRYLDHTAGDNPGGQVHSEITMGAQLKALVDALRGCYGFTAGTLTIDADLFIEKGSMCDACRGTWNTLIQGYAGSAYRSV